MMKNCVYEIICSICRATYIGETQRTMKSRLKEHTSVSSSNVYRHLRETQGQAEITMVTWSVVHRGLVNWKLRQKIEAMTIAQKRPILNAQLMHSSSFSA